MINSNSQIKVISNDDFSTMINDGTCLDCGGDLVMRHPSGDIECKSCGMVYRQRNNKRLTRKLVYKNYHQDGKTHSYK
jgi:ribosomal protein S27E